MEAVEDGTAEREEGVKSSKKQRKAYLKKSKSVSQSVAEDAVEEEGWNEIKNKDGIRVATKVVEDNPIKNGRATGIVQASTSQVVELLRGVEYYHQIDPLYRAGEVIEVLDEDHDILWCRYSAGVFIISDRDFVYMEARTDNFPEEGDILISGYSVEREDVPPKAGIVRGHVYHTGWLIRPIEPTPEEKEDSGYLPEEEGDYCRITFVAQVDLKGWIPTWLVNQMAGEIAKSIASVRKILKKIREDPANSILKDKAKSDSKAKSKSNSDDTNDKNNAEVSKSAPSGKSKSKSKKSKPKKSKSQPSSPKEEKEDAKETESQ